MGAKAEYVIPREDARAIAVGVYRDINTFIQTADKSDYERFKVDYLSRQAAQSPAPVRRKRIRNRSLNR